MLRQAEANGNVSINNNNNNNKGAMEQQERRQRHASDHSQQQERSDTFMGGVQEKRNIKHRTLRNTISLHPIWCKIFIFCRKISLFLLKHSKTQHCSCIIICALEFDFRFFSGLFFHQVISMPARIFTTSFSRTTPKQTSRQQYFHSYPDEYQS